MTTGGEIWTVGHSTLEPEAFRAELAGADIDLLADVRSLPGSRKFPQFDRERMATWLAESGVVYEHVPELGGRRRRSKREPELNAGWQNASFRNYADHTLTDEYEDGLRHVIGLAREHRVALMCAEAVPWRCHRSLIANTLVARGWSVRHLMPDARPIEHELGRWGAPAVVDDGRVLYPPVEA